jgi:hypothetical protein
MTRENVAPPAASAMVLVEPVWPDDAGAVSNVALNTLLGAAVDLRGSGGWAASTGAWVSARCDAAGWEVG